MRVIMLMATAIFSGGTDSANMGLNAGPSRESAMPNRMLTMMKYIQFLATIATTSPVMVKK